MKKSGTRYYIHAIIIGVLCLISVPFFLMYSDIIGRTLQSVIQLKVDPSFGGGRIAAVFYDPPGDDHGYGSLQYPDFIRESGSLDLLRYTVHQPVQGGKSLGSRDFWQLDFSFRALGDKRNIRVYFGLENSEEGSSQTKREFAEGVEFEQETPWQYVVSIYNDSGTIESFDGTFKEDVRVFSSRDRTELFVRISLDDSVLHFLYDLPSVWQYVLLGALDLTERDGFADTAESEFMPKVYDILVPEGSFQEQNLSAWSEDDFSIPVLSPIHVRLSDIVDEGKAAVTATSEALVQYAILQEAAAAEAARNEKDALVLYESKPSDAMEYALAAFNAGKTSEAERLFDAILAKDSSSVSAMAHKGSLVALRGGEAQPLVAVGIIKEAYSWLDRAVERAVSDEEICDSFLNRGHVSMAIPNSVFGKAAQGGDDFLKASESITKLIAGGNESADDSAIFTNEDFVASVCNAARCYELAGEINKAESWYRETNRLLEKIDLEKCAQARLDVFRYYEIGSEKTVKATKKDVSQKEVDSLAKAKNSSEEKLKQLLLDLESAPYDVSLVEAALHIQTMKLDKIEDALQLAERYKSLVDDSMFSQLLIGVAECKMATIVKKTVEKIGWVNKGMNRFDTIQRRWPDDETVYTYQTLTYSSFPSEVGMYEHVFDLLDVMEENYTGGTWILTEDHADLIWQVFSNLSKNYPKKPEKNIILEKTTKMRDVFEIVLQKQKATEVIYE